MENVLPEGSVTPMPKLSAVDIGKTWFRYRSFSPLPFFLLIMILPPQFRLSPLAFTLVALVVVGAEMVRIWAVGYAGSVTRTRGDSVPRLIHAGPFRYLRNPLYVANIALYIGCGVLFGFGTLSFIFLVYFIVQYSFIVRFEESILKKTFGDAYTTYFAEVPRWGIRLTPYVSSGHPFDLRGSLRSERSTFYCLAAMGIAYSLKLAFL